MINRPRMLLVISACGALSLARGADASSSSSADSTTHHASDSASTDFDRPATYRVDKGDTLGSVAHQFHCSIAALRELNDIHHNRLKTGTIIKIPGGHHDVANTHHTKKKHGTSEDVASAKTTTIHHHHPSAAQPVQDFDVSPSTFASCPVPIDNGSEDTEPATVIPNGTPITSATPTGPTTTPANLPAPGVTEEHHTSLLPVPEVAATPPSAENTFTVPRAEIPAATAPAPTPSSTVLAPPTRTKNSFANAISNFFGGSHSSESGEWGNRFLDEARSLAGRGIGYDDSWRPQGESHSWDMDCSNTSRYLYRVTAGIELPRTASDQYYYLHLQDKAWDVPMTSRGFADCNYLRSNLKPGDLLFWENTYKPERQPPITHVMIFLGTDDHGRWLMAGSQSGHHGLYNPHRNGPDVYVFDPTHYSGGYTTWMGLVHHKGRFVAYGRPLEADVKKLSVAEND